MLLKNIHIRNLNVLILAGDTFVIDAETAPEKEDRLGSSPLFY